MTKKLITILTMMVLAVGITFAFERKGGYDTHWYAVQPEVVLTMPSVVDILSQEGLSPEDVTLEFSSRNVLVREKFNGNDKIIDEIQKVAEECSDAGCGQFIIGWFGEGVPESKQYLILWLLDWPDGLKAYPFYYKITINK